MTVVERREFSVIFLVSTSSHQRNGLSFHARVTIFIDFGNFQFFSVTDYPSFFGRGFAIFST
jgi:hypothetical protein